MKHALRTLIVLLVAAATGALQDKDLKAQAKAMSTEVARIRGLKFKKDVKIGIYNRDQLKKFLLGELDKEFPKERAKAVERVMKKFGVLPESLDLRQAVVEFLTSSVGGFYHLKTKELRLIGGEEPTPAMKAMNQQLKAAFGVTMDEITLAHELCHAAQDQTFELIANWPLEEKHENDLVSALKAAIEGDATLLGWSFGVKGAIHALMPTVIAGYKSGKTGTDADKLPAYLRKEMLFPYAYGTEFVYSMWKAKGDDWKAITDLLRDPPLSTEQVLHRNKYETRDHPQQIAHPELDKGFEGGKLLDRNVMGEYGILLMLEELGAADPAGAAAGWDGDRYWAFDMGGNVVILWLSTWDSEEDAREFAEAYAATLERKYPNSKREGEAILLANGERAVAARWGADVFVVDSAAPAAVNKALELRVGFTRTEMTKVPSPQK